MSSHVRVIGAATTRFYKAGTGPAYPELAAQAIRAALADAALELADIGQVCASYVGGDSASGQRVLYEVGLSGVAVVNVNNQCASGSSALFLARQAIEAGMADCVLAVGFEQMNAGGATFDFPDRPTPLDRHLEVLRCASLDTSEPIAAKLFAAAAREYLGERNLDATVSAGIAVKNRRQGQDNPNALFCRAVTLEEVLGSRTIVEPLTKLQCCAPASGAAAAVLCSYGFARRKGLLRQAIPILAQSLVSDRSDSFGGRFQALVGCGMAERAARIVFERSGIDPQAVDVAEVHDCFSINELIAYESLGLSRLGEGAQLLSSGRNAAGRRVVVNPSGGLISKGHPIGATGIGQCVELVAQLRGAAGARQVPQARLGLQHNLGLGGACVVTLYGEPVARVPRVAKTQIPEPSLP